NIAKGKASKVQIKYEVYSFELSVRTSFLDLTHGFVSGTGVFMYVDDLKSKAGKLTVFPYSDFAKVSTALPKLAEGISSDSKSMTYSYSSYDHLVDCPIEIGNQVIFEFTAAGVKHTVAMYGSGNYDIPTLQKDIAKIVESATAIFGENPNKDY